METIDSLSLISTLGLCLGLIAFGLFTFYAERKRSYVARSRANLCLCASIIFLVCLCVLSICKGWTG